MGGFNLLNVTKSSPSNDIPNITEKKYKKYAELKKKLFFP